MDKLKEKINEIVDKIKNDKELANKFKTNPTKTIEDLLGVDVPDEQVEKVIDAVKAKLSTDSIMDTAKDLGSKLKGLFK